MTTGAKIGIAFLGTTVFVGILYVIFKPQKASAMAYPQPAPALNNFSPSSAAAPGATATGGIITTDGNGAMFINGVKMANSQNLTNDQASALMNKALQNPNSPAGMAASMIVNSQKMAASQPVQVSSRSLDPRLSGAQPRGTVR